MKKIYVEPEFLIRNYALCQSELITTSDLNHGDDGDFSGYSKNTESIL